MRYNANPTVPDTSTEIYIYINFTPLEIRKAQLSPPLTAIQMHKKKCSYIYGYTLILDNKKTNWRQ